MDSLSRIEAFIDASVEIIATGSLPTFRFPSRSTPTCDLESTDNCGEMIRGRYDGEERSIDTTLNNNHCLQQHIEPDSLASESVDGFVDKDLISKNGIAAFQIARVFAVLNVVHELLTLSRKCTQRDLYYRLHCPPVFNSIQDVTDAVTDVCCLLQVPRSALNICCSPKGALSGCLWLKTDFDKNWKDCTKTGLAGHAIAGDIDEIDQMQLYSDAICVLVIEKDAIFQRLTEDRFFDLVPAILVTGKGMPDLATRYFLQKLRLQFPHLWFCGLVDWNPSGVAILNIYKDGSHRMGPQAQQIQLPELSWLGIRCHMLQDLPRASFQTLTTRDLSMIRNLKRQMTTEWLSELQVMEETGLKCDIEAIYTSIGIGAFTHLLTIEMRNMIQ